MTTPAGIRANLPQFILLLVINAFVGAMVGLERSVLPLLGEREFGLDSYTAILSFLLTFGPVKAAANLFAGASADAAGRRRLLVAGWLFALPVPFLLMYAPDWSWIIAANLLLGVNQGLCWSMAVIMKIDIAGPERRGLAAGLNEFAGYLAVAAAAWATAEIAAAQGLRSAPFVLGIAVSASGLLLSALFVKDTRPFVTAESGSEPAESGKAIRAAVSMLSLTWTDRRFFARAQAGLVNNLNDGLAWALFPLTFAAAGFSLPVIGVLSAIYPAVWGVGQLGTGPLSDRIGRRGLIGWGMIVQAAGIWLVAAETGAADTGAPGADVLTAAGGMILLGLGTAMVYPTLIASVGDLSRPERRAASLGVYRFWRDTGYAFGAVCAGVLSDLLGSAAAVAAVGALTFISGIVVFAMHDGAPA